MKRFFLFTGLLPCILFSLIFKNASAQQSAQSLITVTISDDYTDKPVEGIQILLLQDGSELTSGTTDATGSVELQVVPTSAEETRMDLPETFQVSDSYPNPFESQSSVELSVDERQEVTAEVFNIIGQRVASLQVMLNPGSYTLQSSLGHLAQGVYFLRIFGQQVQTVKMTKIGQRIYTGGALLEISPAAFQARGGPGMTALALDEHEGTELTLLASGDAYDTVEKLININSDTSLTVEVSRNNEVELIVQNQSGVEIPKLLQVEGDDYSASVIPPDITSLKSGSYSITAAEDTTESIDTVMEIASVDTTIIFEVESIDPDNLQFATLKTVARDSEDDPIEGVTVALKNGDSSSETDASGTAFLEDVPLGLDITLEFIKDGFASHVKKINLPKDIDFSFVETVLVQRKSTVPISDIEQGGEASGTDGVRVELPENSLVTQDGTPVTGDVEVSLTPLNTNNDELEIFPGAFEGREQNGTQGMIASLGVSEYVLSQNGDELQIADGKSAFIEIPLYASEHPDGNPIVIGDDFPLWSLNEESGIWVHESTGTVVASTESPTGFSVRGEVTHFSWWNCDIAIDAPEIIPIPYFPEPGETEPEDGDDPIPPNLNIPPPDIPFRVIGTPPPSIPRARPELDIKPGNWGSLPILPDVPMVLNVFSGNGTSSGSKTVNRSSGSKTIRIYIPLERVGDISGENLACGEILNGILNNPGDVAHFDVELEFDESVNILVKSSEGSTLEGNVTVFGPSDNKIAEGKFTPSKGQPGIIRANEAGTYSIQVTALKNAPGGFSVSKSCVSGLTINSQVDGNLTAGVEDIYAFTATAGTLINSALLRGSGGGSFRVQLADDNNNTLLTTSSVSANNYRETGIYEIEEDGGYILKVFETNGGSGEYTFSLVDIDEPTPITPEAPVISVNGEFDLIGKKHFYSFDGTDDELLNLVLSHPEGDLTAFMQLGDTDGGTRPFFNSRRRTSTGTTASNRTIDISTTRLTSTGTWIIELDPAGRDASNAGRAAGPYQISLYTPEEPVALNFNEEIEATLDPYNILLYTFPATTGRHINAAVLAGEGSGRYRFFVQNSQNSTIEFTGFIGFSSYRETGVFTLQETDTYTIFYDGERGASGSFTLSLVDIDEPTPLSFTDNTAEVSGDI